MRSTFPLMDLFCQRQNNNLGRRGSGIATEQRRSNDLETIANLRVSILDESHGSPYDEIRGEYTATRRADPRIAVYIHQALGDARSVANVSAGAGTYEPHDLDVLPIEPSKRMIAERPPRIATAIRGDPESLPLSSSSVDAAMACLTLHNWTDWRIGLHELRRVARKRVVIFTYDHSYAERFWLLRDYLPKLGRLDGARFPGIEEQLAATGEDVRIEPVPIPHDCVDSFLAAYWRRPSAYLDQRVRADISTFRLPGAERLLGGLEELADDLRTSRWEERNSDILGRTELDLGYRLLVCEL
jgi:SAM-dependent methyltransferase